MTFFCARVISRLRRTKGFELSVMLHKRLWKIKWRECVKALRGRQKKSSFSGTSFIRLVENSADM